MLNDFKKFILRGNIFDLAVGIIIGASFGKIVSSFVADIVTPILSLFMGKVDFSNLFIAMDGKSYATVVEAKAAGVATINLGLFTNAIIDFVIVGFALFLMIKSMEKLKRETPAPVNLDAGTKECPHCLSVIPAKATRCGHCTSSLG